MNAAITFARAAIAIHDVPKCGRHWEFIHVDEDGPVPIDGICSLVAGHRGLCGHAQPDGADWAHLRAALAEIDRLTAELASVGGAMSTQPCATCPACGLRNIPLTNGLLAAHDSHRGELIDGPDDAEGNPTPGEWVGGCENRNPNAKPGEAGR